LGGLIAGLVLSPRIPHPTHPTEPTDQTQTHQTHPTDLTHQTYLTLCVLAACAPDLDFLWGRHNRETHSIVVAVFVGVAVWLATRRPRLALGCALAWTSHVLFDWLGSDDQPPLGVMALWPFTSNFYFADAFVFEAISRRYAEPGFWQQNIWAVVKELLMLVPPTALLWWRHQRRGTSGAIGETRRP
jgi:membrane-bound metal-dependent hydrolase YbcI (DUF457 family)